MRRSGNWPSRSIRNELLRAPQRVAQRAHLPAGLEGLDCAWRLVHRRGAADVARAGHRGRGPHRATNHADQPRRDFRLFDTAELSAAEHRATAERFAAEGNWACRHPAPAARSRHASSRRTACSTRCPGARPPNSPATRPSHCRIWLANSPTRQRSFNDVTYGERPGTEPAYRTSPTSTSRLRTRRFGAAPRRRIGRVPTHGRTLQ